MKSTEKEHAVPRSGDSVTLFLCGDVMTGRGIDQVLPHPSDPIIYEPYMRSAAGYVELAEQINGPIPKPVDFAYIWGDALDELEQMRPDVRIVNLETAITASVDYWRGKGINYRMHPGNIPCLSAARIDCCMLANNHVLDWGHAGLIDTLETLRKAKIKSAGAGRNIREAEAPAVLEIAGKGRVLVFAFGSETSGIPWDWSARKDRPGVNLLPDLTEVTARRIGARVREVKRAGDIVVASIHWGGNWGYAIPREQQAFAHALIDTAGVDIIHGHSSHHPKGIEVHNGRPIFYGCGDFLNDYEGISGYEVFRDDLALMYFVSMDPTSGELAGLRMCPMQIRRFRANRASRQDAMWLRDTLNREGQNLGTQVVLNEGGCLDLVLARRA